MIVRARLLIVNFPSKQGQLGALDVSKVRFRRRLTVSETGVMSVMMAIFRQSRLVMLLKPTDFCLAVRNTTPDVRKVLPNEMWERNDGLFFGCRERADTLNFVLSIPNLSF